MNKKIDLEAIERTLDFESVSKKLETFVESGELSHRKTVADLLDKVRPALIKARENKVTFSALAEFLKTNGIPVSEPTLRQYMNALPDARRTRKRVAKKAPVPTPSEPPSNVSATSPRVARRP